MTFFGAKYNRKFQKYFPTILYFFSEALRPTVRRRAIIAFSHVATRDLTRASSTDRAALCGDCGSIRGRLKSEKSAIKATLLFASKN